MDRYHNIDNCRSYATEASLDKALIKLFGEEIARRSTVVCTRDGRFTAIFPVSAVGCDPAMAARERFLTLG